MALDLAFREIADAVKQEASTVFSDRQNVIYIGVALGALVLLSLIVGSLAMGFALLCGGLAIAYGVWSVRWVLAEPEGNERMRDIAAAVQQGALGLPQPPVRDNR